nr:aquaporin-1 [Quercus suber]
MALIGAVPWVRAALVFLSQILGAMTAAAVVSALFPGPLSVSTTLGGNTSIVRGLFIEMFLTAQLVFTIFMLAAEKHKGTFLAPVGIGLSLFIAEMSGVYFTGGSLNPARSFGPCVVTHIFPGYHWIYWLGPALGAVLAVGFYRFVKVLEYETANPGQDFNEREAEHFEFDEDNATTGADVTRPDPVSHQVTQAMAAQSNAMLSPIQSQEFSEMSETDTRRYSQASRAENGQLGGNYRVQVPPLLAVRHCTSEIADMLHLGTPYGLRPGLVL